jgi:hypothetical protein
MKANGNEAQKLSIKATIEWTSFDPTRLHCGLVGTVKCASVQLI